MLWLRRAENPMLRLKRSTIIQETLHKLRIIEDNIANARYGAAQSRRLLITVIKALSPLSEALAVVGAHAVHIWVSCCYLVSTYYCWLLLILIRLGSYCSHRHSGLRAGVLNDTVNPGSSPE